MLLGSQGSCLETRADVRIFLRTGVLRVKQSGAHGAQVQAERRGEAWPLFKSISECARAINQALDRDGRFAN